VALGSLSGPARVDGAWLWGVHLHVQVGAQRNRRVEPHPAQRAAPGSASVQPRHYVLWSALRWVSRPARLARALDVERVAWPRGEAQPCPGCGLRGRVPFLRANRRATLLTTRQGPAAATAPARAGRNGSSSVRRSVYHVSYEKYVSNVSCNNNRAGARAGGRMYAHSVIRLGQVRDPRRTSDHQMSGCLPYAGWLATPPSLQHLAVAW
jgi:hypothetical protein